MPRERDSDQAQGRRPSDTENLVGETAASEPLTDANVVQPGEAASRGGAGAAPRGAEIPRGTDEHSGMHGATSGDRADAAQRDPGVERETPAGGVERE